MRLGVGDEGFFLAVMITIFYVCTGTRGRVPSDARILFSTGKTFAHIMAAPRRISTGVIGVGPLVSSII